METNKHYLSRRRSDRNQRCNPLADARPDEHRSWIFKPLSSEQTALVGWEPAVSSLGDKKQCNNNRLKWPPMMKIETTVIILEYIEVEVPKQLDNMLRLQRALRKC